MDDIYAARVMTSDLHTVSPDTFVEDAADVMMDNDIGSVVVTDDHTHVEGILTRTDFVEIVAESRPKAETTVARYMTEDVYTTEARTPIREIADEMIDRGIHHIPIVDAEEGLVGIVTSTDLTDYLAGVQTPSPSS